MAAATDAEILTLYREGRVEAAFRLMVAAHGEKVYNIALFTLNDENLAADASQEVFIKVYRNLGRFKGDASLSTWLYRIAKNVCYDPVEEAAPRTAGGRPGTAPGQPNAGTRSRDHPGLGTPPAAGGRIGAAGRSTYGGKFVLLSAVLLRGNCRGHESAAGHHQILPLPGQIGTGCRPA